MSTKQFTVEAYHKECSEKSLDQLNKIYEEIGDKLYHYKGEFTGENLQKIRNLFLTSETVYKLDFKLATVFREVKNKFLADTDKVVIDIAMVRVIQNLITSMVFQTNAGADIVADFIEAVQEANAVVFELESKIQVCSVYITRKSQEVETGLKFSEEDNKNISEMEVRPPEHMDTFDPSVEEKVDSTEVEEVVE